MGEKSDFFDPLWKKSKEHLDGPYVPPGATRGVCTVEWAQQKIEIAMFNVVPHILAPHSCLQNVKKIPLRIPVQILKSTSNDLLNILNF